MAGFEIVNTYKAYKVREKKVTTWLKETAAQFGFKGTAKPESVSHLLRITEIPAAVKLIVSNGGYVFLVLLFRYLVKYLGIFLSLSM
jgi:hypothetical protein